MSECACDAVFLGREYVQGTANADSLASLVRLVTRRAGSRKCRLRCSRDGIEFRPARRQEDEGFESDDDAVSQTSSDSNTSSCCFVEDHVLKCSASPTANVATDSANSSGVSDNDDGDNSLTPTTTPTPQQQRPVSKPKKPSVDECIVREFYSFNDVAFCHTDASFPKVLVVVIKKKSKTNKDEIDSTTGLEAVIFQCKSVENLREVCASYKEFSRRLKMDLQFRYPHRRKESTVDNPTSTLYRNVFNDLQKSMSSTATTTTSPFFKTWITHVASKEVDFQPSDSNNKYNLVQRTDDDGVTHIEVSKAVDGEYVNTVTTDEYSGSSSIISISTPDIGNLFVSPHNPYPSINESSGDSSEIEGVICADVESSHSRDTAAYKKGSITEKVESKTAADSAALGPDTPPQRPQRGKYVKKNAPKPNEHKQNEIKSKPSNASTKEKAPKPPTQEPSKQPGTHEKVVRGQFIRVNVEQQNPQSSAQSVRTGHRLFGGETKPAGQMLSYPMWNTPATQRTHRSRQEEVGNKKQYQRRSRSSGSGRRSTSPSAKPPPRRSSSPPARPSAVTYRQIEINPPKPFSNRFFGKLKEIASINNAYVGTLSRRRNSSGDLSTAQFYQYLEPALKTSSMSKSSTNLKSVIKKKNCNEHIEPKKVTFSAYATVQVVD